MINQPWILSAALLVLAVVNAVLIILIVIGRPRQGKDTLSIERIGERLERIDRISGDLEALSNLFMVPHARGGLGETLLAELLRSWLPAEAYDLQYSFASGARVDAVIKLGHYLVPVDAKFPLESMKTVLSGQPGDAPLPAPARRAFQKHIDDIRSRYIRPEEGTLQFALMYIPSERVFYHAFVVSDTGLLDEAVRAGVVPVGPGSLFLYLQTVAYGLRGMTLSERQREIMDGLSAAHRELEALARSFSTATGHLKNLSNAHDEVSTRLGRLGTAVNRARAVGGDEPEARRR